MSKKTRPIQPERPMLSNAAFEAATTLHNLGRLADADRLYKAQLQVVRDHFGALHNLAMLNAQLGQLKEAETLIRRALRRNPKSAEAHNTLGGILHRLGRHAEANTVFGRALALKPDYAQAYNNRGVTLHAMSRTPQAVTCFERALAIIPRYADAHLNLGRALRALGQNEEALDHFDSALDERPNSAAAHRVRGDTLYDLKRPKEAIDSYLNSLGLEPGDAEIYYNLGTALFATDRFEEAIANYRRAIELKPDYAEAHNNLGSVFLALDRPVEAMAWLEKSLELMPLNAAAHVNLGQALLILKRPAEAVGSLELALSIDPDHTVAHTNLGVAFRELGRYEEAIEHFEAALRTRSEYGQAHANLESALREAGRTDDIPAKISVTDLAVTYAGLGNLSAALGRADVAREALEKAVDIAPRPEYYFGLSEAKTFKKGDRHLVGLEALAKQSESLSHEEQVYVQFSLGKALADIGEFERSFQHYLKANALKRQEFVYDEERMLAGMDAVRQFARETIEAMRGMGDPSPRPVFIVGMPRSGTSLIEQILASHPRVFGAGELENFRRLMTGADPRGITGEWLRMVGRRYVAEVEALAPPSDRITDKMPGNFLLVGFIHVALPNARIIHARRNPLDTCLSCFSKRFEGEQAFAYDLGELGRYYRAYQRVMAHWRSVLPEGVMLEVDYEDVVADLETQARRIVGYCGLEWDNRCLEFHKTERAVRTASVTQVRQPIYRSSVGRWRAYGHLLTPLLEALELDPVCVTAGP